MKLYTDATKGSPKSSDSPKQLAVAMSSSKNTGASSNAQAYTNITSKQTMYSGIKHPHPQQLKSLN